MSSEIEKFKIKAEGYKAALKIAPLARILETTYILGIIDDFVKYHNLERREVVILDLMAGSGFLSEVLFNAGFRKLHAIEVCNEMSHGAEIFKEKVELYWVSDILNISPIIQDIKPLVIVSLASFHHLISKENDGSINISNSIDMQEHVFKTCIENLTNGGLVLIADIFESSIMNSTKPPTNYWNPSRPTIRLIAPKSFKWLRRLVKKAKSLKQLSHELNQITGMHENANPTLHWFRAIVDKQTSIGHDDNALSLAFVERIGMDREIGLDIVSCPWLFEEEFELKNFIINKFGFSLDEENHRPLDKNIFDQANEIVGIKKKDDILLFNWRLAIITHIKPLSDRIRPIRLSTIWLFAILDFIILILIILKACWIIDVKANPSAWIQYMLFMVLGILIGRIFDWVGKHNR